MGVRRLPISWWKSLILPVSKRQRDQEGDTWTQAGRGKEKEINQPGGGQNLFQPPAFAPLHLVPSTHPAPSARCRVLGSEKGCQPPRSPAMPAPCPALPGRGVPSSPESSHSSVRVEHPCVWRPGVGLGLRPWPGLSFQWVPQLSQEAEKQV